MDIRKTIDLFLRRQLFVARQSPVYVLKLRCVGTGPKKGKPVDEFSISPGFEAGMLENFVDEILQRAQMDCDGRSGVVRYALHAYAKGSAEIVGSCAFRMRAEEAEWEENDGEEEASLTGLVKQQMRHNEALVRTLAQTTTALNSIMVRQMESTHRMNEKLIEGRSTMLEAHEASLSMQSERDIELLKASGDEERKNAAFGKAMLLAPLLINKIAGQPVMKADDPMTIMLREFANSISPDQLKQLAGSLNTEQQIILFSVFKQVKTLPAGSNGKA